MTRRKHGHRRDTSSEGFSKWVSVILNKVKPRKSHSSSEGPRRMTKEEERAAMQVVNLGATKDPEEEVIISKPVDDTAGFHFEDENKHVQSGENDVKGLRKLVLAIANKTTTKKHHTLSEGTRLMTREEERAAIEAAWAPRLGEVVQEMPKPGPENNPAEIIPEEQAPDWVIPPVIEVSHHKHQNIKRKPKRWWRIFGRKRNKGHVPIVLSATKHLEADAIARKKKSYRSYLKPTLNSTSLFVIAYLIVWFTYQFGVMIQASFSDIDSVLYYYEVMFPIGNYSHLWSQFNIILITAAGPMLSVIMGIIYRFVFLGRTNPGTQMRQFLVWLYLNSMAFFFGAFVAGIITNQGFGYVAGWLYMNIVFRIGISLIFLFILGFQGWKTLRYLPEVSGSDSFKRSRKVYVLSRLTIPWFIGSILMLILKRTSFVPQHPNIYEYDMIILGSLLFPVVAAIFNKRERPAFFKNPRHSITTRTVTISLIAAFMLCVIVRLGLSQGLYLQLKIALDISMYR